jgi:hypothetical protein
MRVTFTSATRRDGECIGHRHRRCRHNLDVKWRFLRVATPFQLPLFNFYERVSSLPTEADAVSTMMSRRC